MKTKNNPLICPQRDPSSSLRQRFSHRLLQETAVDGDFLTFRDRLMGCCLASLEDGGIKNMIRPFHLNTPKGGGSTRLSALREDRKFSYLLKDHFLTVDKMPKGTAINQVKRKITTKLMAATKIAKLNSTAKNIDFTAFFNILVS